MQNGSKDTLRHQFVLLEIQQWLRTLVKYSVKCLWHNFADLQWLTIHCLALWQAYVLPPPPPMSARTCHRISGLKSYFNKEVAPSTTISRAGRRRCPGTNPMMLLWFTGDTVISLGIQSNGSNSAQYKCNIWKYISNFPRIQYAFYIKNTYDLFTELQESESIRKCNSKLRIIGTFESSFIGQIISLS